jgi:hypothetical protein
MTMKGRLDMQRIGRSLRVERSGKVTAAGGCCGYFGAAQLAADIQTRRCAQDERGCPSEAGAGRTSGDGDG